MYSHSILLVALLAQALPAIGAVHEQLASLPLGWTAGAPAAPSSKVSFTVALTEENIDQLESKLMSVSTPGSASYGKHLDIDDVNALFPPTAGASEAVQSWLKSHGVSQVAAQGSYVTFATDVKTANALLNTTFLDFSHSSGSSKIRTMEYSIPSELQNYVDFVDPTVFIGKTVAAVPVNAHVRMAGNVAVERDGSQSCAQTVTPTCLKEFYNVNGYTPDPNSGARVGFGSFLNASSQYSDLFQYEQTFGIPHQNISTVLIAGATNDQNVATANYGEANLDVQNIIGMSHPLPVTEFITGGSPPYIPNLDGPTQADNQNEPYLPYYRYLLSQPNSELPQVISNSYGDDEQTVPLYYAKHVCNLVGKMGLRGISVLESSGDNGVGAPCRANDGSNALQFTPQFPATCPYITGVGGTVGVPPESAWVGSGGGFSNYFSRPWFQEIAIENYLNFHISPEVKQYYQPYTNFQGRGFPDVSALSIQPNYLIVEGGQLSQTGGTSASAPLTGAIIALLNDARFRAGKQSSLGFLNPLLYAFGFFGFTDITTGGSQGCTGVSIQSGQPVPGGGIIPYASWNATPGWDPATGFGTPNFEILRDLALLLP